MVRFTLRISEHLRDFLAEKAVDNERSLNAQIVYILKTWCDVQEPANSGELPGELSPLGGTVNQEAGGRGLP